MFLVNSPITLHSRMLDKYCTWLYANIGNDNSIHVFHRFGQPMYYGNILLF